MIYVGRKAVLSPKSLWQPKAKGKATGTGNSHQSDSRVSQRGIFKSMGKLEQIFSLVILSVKVSFDYSDTKDAGYGRRYWCWYCSWSNKEYGDIVYYLTKILTIF